MRIDKQLSEEFGTELPPVSWSYSMLARAVVGTAIQLNNIAKVAVYCWWLAFGALAAHYVPGVMWWFLAASGVASVIVLAIAFVIWLANAADWPEHNDGSYPGS